MTVNGEIRKGVFLSPTDWLSAILCVEICLVVPNFRCSRILPAESWCDAYKAKVFECQASSVKYDNIDKLILY